MIWAERRLSALMCLLLSVGAGGCLDTVYAIGEHSDTAQWVRTQQARIEISGTIRDERGQQLRDVCVHYVREYLVAGFSEPGPEEREDEESRTVSNEFHFTWSVAESVHLAFQKPGYRSAELTISVQPTVNKGDYGRTTPPAAPVARKEIIVVLKHISTETP